MYTCTLCHFRRIAGLNSTRAKKIIDWRETNGLFVNREQLKCLKGIGDKSYEQCAGFIRVNTKCISTEYV
jgi:competence ComEA-like helix-hairpin-helix protein